MLSTFRLIILVILTITAGHAKSQSNSQQAFEQGYQAYMRNQFPIAESHFRSALQSAPTNQDKAFILKFLGISQYMRGDKRSATESFNNAILLDPKISVFKEEVLDASVIPFFNSTKRATLKKYKSKMQIVNKKKSNNKKKKPKIEELTQTQSTQVEAESTSGSFNYAHLMPFGIGHFLDGSVFWGLTYGVGQVATLAIYFKKVGEISKEENENKKTLERTDITNQEKENFIDENSDYISLLKSDSQLAISIFGGLYVSSLVHGILSDPPSNPKVSGFSLTPMGIAFQNIETQSKSQTFLLTPFDKGLALHASFRFN